MQESTGLFCRRVSYPNGMQIQTLWTSDPQRATAPTAQEHFRVSLRRNCRVAGFARPRPACVALEIRQILRIIVPASGDFLFGEIIAERPSVVASKSMRKVLLALARVDSKKTVHTGPSSPRERAAILNARAMSPVFPKWTSPSLARCPLRCTSSAPVRRRRPMGADHFSHAC